MTVVGRHLRSWSHQDRGASIVYNLREEPGRNPWDTIQLHGDNEASDKTLVFKFRT